MESSGYTKKQLLQEIQLVREDLQEFKTKKAQPLRESLDVLEKQVNKIPARHKFAIQTDAARLKTIAASVVALRKQGIIRFYHVTNGNALFLEYCWFFSI